MSTAADAPTLQAQPSSHISRSLSLLKSVRSPKNPQKLTKAVRNLRRFLINTYIK
ncbi:MAG: hypothetical protein ACM65L_26475 [Microcoleus sp.]